MHTGVVCHAYLVDLVFPVKGVILGGCAQHVQQGTIESFHQAIALGVVRGGPSLLYIQNPAYLLE